ncbi:MAG TPA: sulfur oxidation c-type cytochrome SoxA [Burkholderiaceae bacterium]|nr:sulfur oxidation c-type cytochrome SoxA [Burkholderiaceae bacterium]HQR70711.1 sulfur oxidation c-type cytochrome SoxA [Burkholderiaceae bacterium]
MNGKILAGMLAAAVLGIASAGAVAQGSAQDEIARYRAMLQDGNPAELVVARGEELWKMKRGPKNASLEQCDLGLGPGVVKGAYAQLPRYFADADQVMDFESRLVWCMVNLQGLDRAAVTKRPYSGAGEKQTDIEALTAFGVEMSRGMPVNVPQSHPKEKAAFDRGRYAFYMRGGPYDFSCATCHGVTGQRIRLQDLPNISGNKADADRAFTTWPAYRVSQGTLRTMQWRLNDCFRQQRFPDLVFLSPTSIDLITFLGVNANGAKMDAPAIKR